MAIRWILIGASLFALFANAFRVIAPNYNRITHWGLLATAVLLLYRRDGSSRSAPEKADVFLALLAASSSIFVLLDWPYYIERTGIVTRWELLFGIVMILIVLETTRRTIGWFLPATAVIFLIYALLGNYAPGIFVHKGYDLDRLVGILYVGGSGIYGLPMDISATFVIMFVLFGSLLTYSGGDRWFIDISHSLMGRLRGGPAYTAIISSALMGMLSGSPVANVMTIGNFTIPLMKRTGFRPHMAGAIEAVASTAGMFTPPIMGAGAFLIAEYLRRPYVDVAKAAILPSLLFYISVMALVYLWARRLNLRAGSEESLPGLWRTLSGYGHMIPPVIILVALIFSGRSLMLAALWAMCLTVGFSLLRSHTRIRPRNLLAAMEETGRRIIPIAVACASAGIIVGVMNLTGLGFSLSAALTALSHGQNWLLLVFTMVASLVLGCAIPPTAVYIIVAGLTVPTLVAAGFSPLAAHFFVFFFSSVGAITPPVALAAYAASAIADSNVNRTGWTALHLGIAGYVIPFLVMYQGGLLLEGKPGEIVAALGVSLLVILGISFSIQLVTDLLVRGGPGLRSIGSYHE